MNYLVVGGVVRVVPIFDHGPEHSACFPPVVGGGQIARYVAGVVAGVIVHHSPCYGVGCVFDGCWRVLVAVLSKVVMERILVDVVSRSMAEAVWHTVRPKAKPFRNLIATT